MRIWLAAYLAVMLIGAAVFGDVWFERADPFEVYSSLVAKLSFWGRDGDRGSSYAARWRTSPRVTPRPGLLAVVAVLFGSTAFDTYKDTLPVAAVRASTWASTSIAHQLGRRCWCSAWSSAAPSPPPRCRPASRRPAPHAVRRTALPALFAHSVVPIIVGYMTAHYLSYLVEQGQTTLIQLSDPMVRGDNLLGTANLVGELLAVLPPDAARGHQGARRRRPATSSA